MTAVADASVFSGQVTTQYAPADGWHSAYANYNVFHNGTLIGTLASSTTVIKAGSKGHFWGYYVNDTQTFSIPRPIKKDDLLQISLVNSSYFNKVNMLAFLSN